MKQKSQRYFEKMFLNICFEEIMFSRFVEEQKIDGILKKRIPRRDFFEEEQFF